MVFSPGIPSLVLTFVLFHLTVLGLIFGWLPRVTARRRAAELQEDPGAFARHRRGRRIQIASAVQGLLIGLGAILWAALSGGT